MPIISNIVNIIDRTTPCPLSVNDATNIFFYIFKNFSCFDIILFFMTEPTHITLKTIDNYLYIH